MPQSRDRHGNLNGRTSILAMSREQYHNHNLNIPNQNFDRLVVGAAVLQPPTDAEDRRFRILLLKRSATDIYLPSVYEIPGGKEDVADGTIGDALLRGLREGAHLKITCIFPQLPDFTYTMEKPIWKDDGSLEIITEKTLQLNFAVFVDGLDFHVNPEMHSSGLWATKDMLADLVITTEMRKVATMALEMAERLGV